MKAELEKRINNLLLKGRLAAENLYAQGRDELALAVLQTTSQVALLQMNSLPKPEKLICRCGKILRIGKEIEFYKHVGSCYNCDSAYVDSLENE